MDELEKFIKENRDKLDIYNPPRSVWKKIRRETGVRTYHWQAAAAIALLITGLSALYLIIKTQKTNMQSLSKKELNEAVVFYSVRYTELFNKAKPLLNKQPDLREELNNDMERLDSIMSLTRKDLKDRVANSEVIEALIQNYRTRILILEDMLDILKETENENGKNKDHLL